MAKLGKIETEEAWLAAVNAKAMLNVFKGQAIARQRRLLAVAVCRHCEAYAIDEPWQAILAVAEQYADGKASTVDLEEARTAGNRLANKRQRISRSLMANAVVSTCQPLRMDFHALYYFREMLKAEGTTYSMRDKRLHCSLVRDIYGNPFQKVAFPTAWTSPKVRSLCEGMYDGRDYAAMPILGDALEEAGCTDEAVLDHCKNFPVHVRGCWVVDGLLGLRKPAGART